MTLTEKEKAVIEEYCNEIAELEKTDNARYAELREAIKKIIDEQLPEIQSVFIKAFKFVDKPSGNEDFEVDRCFELTRELVRQIEAKSLRRHRHPRRPFPLLDYLDNETLIILVEDKVSEEQKATLQNACEAFAKRLNHQYVYLIFLNAPSELDFSYPDDSKVPKSLFNKNVLLISKSEPCLDWFERTCVIPLREDGRPVPRYISVQPKSLFPDEAHWTPDYHNIVFAYPCFSKIAKFKGVIILADDEYVPRPVDFDLLAEHFEKKNAGDVIEKT